MTGFINKIITVLLVPILTLSFSPVMLIKRAVYKPQEVISLCALGYTEQSEALRITAHRGVTALAPENTVPAYEKAVEYGFYAAEFDIRLTTDMHWVLSHNNDINHRMWQFGNFEDFDLATLKTYSYKSGVSFWAYGDLRIPTLEEVLDVFAGSSTHPQIHIKTQQHYDYLYTVADALRERGLADGAQIVSDDFEQLRALHDYAPELELWYIIGEVTMDEIEKIREFGDKGWFTAYYEENTPESIQLAIDEGVNVSYGTFSTAEEILEAYEYGIRYIETDNICN